MTDETNARSVTVAFERARADAEKIAGEANDGAGERTAAVDARARAGVVRGYGRRNDR